MINAPVPVIVLKSNDQPLIVIPSEAEEPAVLPTGTKADEGAAFLVVLGSPLSSGKLRENDFGKNRYGVKARRADHQTSAQPGRAGIAQKRI
jgi:hypothetical protein